MRCEIVVVCAVITLFSSASAYASSEDCNSALVMSTYSNTTDRFSDARLAISVSEMDYEEIKHNAGANAVIYGVPVGGNYDDFQKRAHDKAASLGKSLTESEKQNVLWTGLDQSSGTAYSSCIQYKIAALPGIHMAPVSATESDIGVRIIYNVVGTAPNPVQLSWSVPDKKLPKYLTAGTTFVTFERPAKQMTVNVNGIGAGIGDFVVLDHLPTPPPPQPAMPPDPCKQPEGPFTPTYCLGTRVLPSVGTVPQSYHWCILDKQFKTGGVQSYCPTRESQGQCHCADAPGFLPTDPNKFGVVYDGKNAPWPP